MQMQQVISCNSVACGVIAIIGTRARHRHMTERSDRTAVVVPFAVVESPAAFGAEAREGVAEHGVRRGRCSPGISESSEVITWL